MFFKTKLSGKQASFGHPRSQDAIGPGSPSPSSCVTRLHSPKTLLSVSQLADIALPTPPSCPGRLGVWRRTLLVAHVPHARCVTPARPPTPPAPSPRGHSVTLSASAAAAVGCCASVEQAAMWSLRGLRLAAGETRVCGRQEGASPVGVSYLLQPCEDRSALASAGGWPRETLASGAPSRSSHLELLA